MDPEPDEMWAGFARAIVRLDLPEGSVVLQPTNNGVSGTFPFNGAVHIVTASNPDGVEVSGPANLAADEALDEALNDYETFRTVGSAPDGSFAEPGFGILGIEPHDALAFGARFGQVAIYRWSADDLVICAVGSDDELRLGWRLDGSPTPT